MKRRIGSVNTLHQQCSTMLIRFDKTYLMRVQIPYEDPLVVSLTVAECLVRRVLIDPGSSANIMPRVTFDRLEINLKELKSTGNPLLGFDGKGVEPIGTVELMVRAAERNLVESFVVVEIHPSYNLLMGRGWIHRVQGVPSTLHQKPPLSMNGEEELLVLTEEPLVEVQIDHLSPDWSRKIGFGLAEEEKRQLVDFLSENADVFAWSHLDMPGIDPSVSCHILNVDPNVKPVRQK
ncbi:uncharacterized protein LOC132272399 [Cornus florida]|uniref:uncharacterized protein LOC132272399 n=1 Tax=Cornus florida TaxID=4283 RepID=UPI00289CECCA|nr:uncharacterized protein LOC132272399 [Cornus florida]